MCMIDNSMSARATSPSMPRSTSASLDVIDQWLCADRPAAGQHLLLRAATRTRPGSRSPPMAAWVTVTRRQLATAELLKGPSSGIQANRISISAEFIDLNGCDPLTARPTTTWCSTPRSTTKSQKIERAGRPASGSADHRQCRRRVQARTGTPKTKQIVIEEFRVPGGSITITGNLMNTGNGLIEALGGYVHLKVANNTNRDLVIQRIDVTDRGAGTIRLNDKAKATDGGYLQTWYQMEDDGTVTVRTSRFDLQNYRRRRRWRCERPGHLHAQLHREYRHAHRAVRRQHRWRQLHARISSTIRRKAGASTGRWARSPRS